MASTSFVDLVTLTSAPWFNQVDTVAYSYLTGVAGTDTITATGPVSMTAYAAGQKFHFISAGANTGAVTLNITPSGGAALGAKAVTKNGSTALAANDIPSGAAVDVTYDGTRFIIGSIALGTMATQAASAVAITGGSILGVALGAAAPIDKTANFTVGAGEFSYLVALGTPVTVTLPTLTGGGRLLLFVNRGAGAINSASSNVVVLSGGAAGTDIVSAGAGKWGLLQDAGSAWQTVMAVV